MPLCLPSLQAAGNTPNLVSVYDPLPSAKRYQRRSASGRGFPRGRLMGRKGSTPGRIDTLVRSDLSDLISKVYDAALDPVWPAALEGLCGGLRFRSYAKFNPATDPTLPFSRQTVSVGSQPMREKTLRVSRLSSDWMHRAPIATSRLCCLPAPAGRLLDRGLAG